MKGNFEYNRIVGQDINDKYPPGWTEVIVEAVFNSSQDAISAADKIYSVVKNIALYSQNGYWPAEKEWKKILPAWLLDRFHYLTREELEEFLRSGHSRGELGWHFGSWLDAMYERAWRWWNFKIDNNRLAITLLVDSWPYSLGAFQFLAKAAGSCEIKEL